MPHTPHTPHTPAPWEIEPGNDGDLLIVSEEGYLPVIVASVHMPHAGDDETDAQPEVQKANAALLRAAPELLAAAECALSLLAQKVRDDGKEMALADRLSGVGGTRAYHLLAAAVAIAKGQHP